MKKLLLTALTFGSALTFAFAGGNEVTSHDTPLDNGLSLKLHLGFTGEEYGMSSEELAELKVLDASFGTNFSEELVPAVSFGVELGSQWYVYKTDSENLGVGIFVNWFDFDFAAASYSFLGAEFTSAVINASLLEFGPVVTYALNDDMGIDAYYQLCPTIMARAITFDTEDNVASGFGFTHALGVAFRYRLLYAGLEYNTGDVELIDTDDEDYKSKVSTNSLRFLVGFKF